MGHGVGNICAAYLNMATQQRGSDFTAALQCHITQVPRVDPCGLGDQGGLHPVLAAHGAARADHHFTRVFFQGLNQIIEILVGRVLLHRNGTVAGADRCQPAHGVFIEAAELALGQVKQGTTGPGYQGASIGRALGDHGVVGNSPHATWHVGHTHGFAQQLLVDQCALRQFAGQVKAAARGRRGNAFGAFGFSQQLASEEHAAGRNSQSAQGEFHIVSSGAFIFIGQFWGVQNHRDRARVGVKYRDEGLRADRSACRCSIIVLIGENASRRFSDHHAVHDGDRDCCQSRDASRPTFR